MPKEDEHADIVDEDMSEDEEMGFEASDARQLNRGDEASRIFHSPLRLLSLDEHCFAVIKDEEMAEGEGREEDELPVSAIDAYWLQRE